MTQNAKYRAKPFQVFKIVIRWIFDSLRTLASGDCFFRGLGSGEAPYMLVAGDADAPQTESEERAQEEAACALRKEVAKLRYAFEEDRQKAVVPRAALVLAVDGGLLAAILDQLRTLRSCDEEILFLHVRPMAAIFAALFCSLWFTLASLRSKSYGIVSVPENFDDQISSNLWPDAPEAAANYALSAWLLETVDKNVERTDRRFILTDCAIWLTIVAALGIILSVWTGMI